MAKCTVDPNPKIASHSKRLFEELAKKNNTLYNVLADIISRLSGHSADSCHDDAEKQVTHCHKFQFHHDPRFSFCFHLICFHQKLDPLETFLKIWRKVS